MYISLYYVIIVLYLDGMFRSPCLSLLEDMRGKALTGAYVPRCTDQGEFDSMQCWGSTGECWCVDELGVEIQNTRSIVPDRPQCDTGSK